MFYFYDKRLIENNRLYCIGISQTPHLELNEDLRMKYPDDVIVIYEGDKPFEGIPYIDGKQLRNPNRLELIELGKEELQPGEYIVNGMLKKIESPGFRYSWTGTIWILDPEKLLDGEYIENSEVKYIPCLEDFKKPKWNSRLRKWEESYGDLETLESLYKEYIKLNTPLHFEKMREQNLLTEYITLIDDLENGIEVQRGTAVLRRAISFKEPSKELREFKEHIFKL